MDRWSCWLCSHVNRPCREGTGDMLKHSHVLTRSSGGSCAFLHLGIRTLLTLSLVCIDRPMDPPPVHVMTCALLLLSPPCIQSNQRGPAMAATQASLPSHVNDARQLAKWQVLLLAMPSRACFQLPISTIRSTSHKACRGSSRCMCHVHLHAAGVVLHECVFILD